MDPPSYDDATGRRDNDGKGGDHDRHDTKDDNHMQHMTICDEVGVSRSQHVAALVTRLLPQIRQRARAGLARSPLLILPSDQDKLSARGQLIGFHEELVVIQLQGRYDGSQFWAQQEALDLLREMLIAEIAGQLPPRETPLPPRVVVPERSTTRTSWFGRRTKREAEMTTQQTPVQAPSPVKVAVTLEEANFRSENEYGMCETLHGPAVLVIIEIVA